MESYLITLLLIPVIGGVGVWLRKRYLKKVMAQGLGRSVKDRELTDIAEWMDAIPDEPPPRNEPSRPHG